MSKTSADDLSQFVTVSLADNSDKPSLDRWMTNNNVDGKLDEFPLRPSKLLKTADSIAGERALEAISTFIPLAGRARGNRAKNHQVISSSVRRDSVEPPEIGSDGSTESSSYEESAVSKCKSDATPRGHKYKLVALRAVMPPNPAELKASSVKQTLEPIDLTPKKDTTVKETSTRPELTNELPVGKQDPQVLNGGHTEARKSSFRAHPSKPAASKTSQSLAQQNHAKPPFPFAGILAALGSSVLFSFSFLLIKLLPDPSSGLGMQEKIKAVFIRGGFIASFCGIAIMMGRSTILVKRNELWVIVARCILGSSAVMCSFSALEFISLGDATALLFCAPIWTNLLSNLILKEPFHWILLVSLPASIFGIILIAHPTLIVSREHLAISSLDHHRVTAVDINSGDLPDSGLTTTLMSIVNQAAAATNDVASSELDISAGIAVTTAEESTLEHLDERWPGIVIALVGSILVACSFIVFKFRKETPIQTTTFWFGIGQMTLSLIFMSIFGFVQLPSSGYEWLLLLGNAFLSWLGQCMMQWSFEHEEVGILSIVRTNDVAMCFILSAIFLDEEIYWTSIVGSTIVGLVVAVIIVRNWFKSCCKKTNPDPQAPNDTTFVSTVPGAHSVSLDLDKEPSEAPVKSSSATSAIAHHHRRPKSNASIASSSATGNLHQKRAVEA